MPKPGPRQVLVKVAACSLNFRDLAIVLGTYRMPVKPNLVPLSDGAGEVVDVGAGVNRVKAGDRVAGCFFQRWIGGPMAADTHGSALGGGIDGMLAEYAVLEEHGVVKLPAASVMRRSRNAAVRRGNGVARARRARPHRRGPDRACAGHWRRLDLRAAIRTAHGRAGDGHLVERSEARARQSARCRARRELQDQPEWDKAAVEWSGGGVDHVVEVGGPGTLAQSLRAIRIGGKITLIGVLSGAAEINPMLIFARRANLQGISVGSMQMFEAMNRAIAASGLEPSSTRSSRSTTPRRPTDTCNRPGISARL